MGRGIALEFRARFPRMYAEYKRQCAAGQFKLGDVFTWVEGGTTIYNLATQQTWRTRAELKAIETATAAMVRLAEEGDIARIGMPRIGAGLGGLKWEDVRSVLARVGGNTPVELMVFEKHESSGPSA
jgi:O-acetyl-ADP-ribose deacetylase (regulator of RNase III)